MHFVRKVVVKSLPNFVGILDLRWRFQSRTIQITAASTTEHSSNMIAADLLEPPDKTELLTTAAAVIEIRKIVVKSRQLKVAAILEFVERKKLHFRTDFVGQNFAIMAVTRHKTEARRVFSAKPPIDLVSSIPNSFKT